MAIIKANKKDGQNSTIVCPDSDINTEVQYLKDKGYKNIHNAETGEVYDDKTIKELLAGDVFDEDFSLAFYALLEKFVNEYDDMAYMKAIKQAQALYKTMNE